eukprot:6912449-Prymnesium_polylepis.1
MKADHPAEGLRVTVAARGIAACSCSVSAPRGRSAQRSAEGRPPRQGTRRTASWAQARQAPGRRAR